ncbi:MAG TPA: VIT and VWA domain-containing protein, partial [Candidatus Tectomicrobia bacterium]
VYELGLAFVLLLVCRNSGTAQPPVPGGELHILDHQGQPVGACPLKHTTVEASIHGFFSRVRVRQSFYNPLETKIEAVYTFPLPQNAAVDDMVMTVGERRIVSQIKPRDEARTLYESARAAGHVTSLLDQERPNIFTQSVANVEPGVRVVIELSYVETLQYEDGVFEFIFPMVVGPRYMPGSAIGTHGTGRAPDTTQVPDAARISPPVTPPGTRAGHDISLTVLLDAGMEIFELGSPLHQVQITRQGPGQATVTLPSQAEIPNKDFVLRYRTATDQIGDALLTHTEARGTFFTLILQPPRRVLPAQAMPREMLFVIDRSGSMSGFPIEKAKETMRLAIEQMHPHDTFNLLSFSGGTGRCFPVPVPNTPQNRTVALRYLADLYGSGGTEIMPAILEALGGSHDPKRLRIVAFMTDGYIGNDYAIIDAVRRHAGTARVFAFGIGNAVNRFLLDGMAHAGRGAVEYVTLQSQADGASKRFHERIQAPVLTDIALDWGTLPVTDVYPRHIPDLFGSQPLVLHGRLTDLRAGTLTLRGHTGTGPFTRQMRVQPPTNPEPHAALASLWARAAITDLMQQDYAALQPHRVAEEQRRKITALGVEFRLMTPFTSLVAVEEMTVTVGGTPVTVAVPVELPAGVRYEGIFGQTTASSHMRLRMMSQAVAALPFSAKGVLPASPMLRDQTVAESVGQQHDPAPRASARLDGRLHHLARKVAREGQDGNLTLGALRVIEHQVDVMIYLHNTTAETLNALTQLGFVQTGESKVTRLVIGRLDVRHLEQLAQLEAVIRVTPVVS